MNLIRSSSFRDRDDLQQEELATSLQMGRGSLDHGGESRMTPHHTKILHKYNAYQDAEDFLKTTEGAKMLKIHQVEKEVEEEDKNEEGSGSELQESTDNKSETIDEEKGAEN